MNQVVKFASLIVFAGIAISCKREMSCVNCQSNQPPVAKAGPDESITLPTDSVLLDGSKSSDPDGTIVKYQWSKISGPSSFVIANSNSANTVVRALIQGLYQFELSVTDNGGLSAKDTVQIIVNAATNGNRPPVANAGPDQTITLPTNTVNLDGSSSSDPDNNITTYAWRKIAGPATFTIANANAVQTQVNNLVQGTYQFELKVTDAGGLFAKDTVQIVIKDLSPPPPTITCDPLNRTFINAHLTPIGTLSQARIDVAVATAGNKILMAGGIYQSGNTSRVDIYDVITGNWTTSELSERRAVMQAIGDGNKVYFAGGFWEDDAGGWHLDSLVDIYDVSSGARSAAYLSTARQALTTAALGNKVFFAGGIDDNSSLSKTVDIYDLSSNTWSTAQLSQPRYGLTAANVGNKVYFAGGISVIGGSSTNVIDIYDGQMGTWSVSSMATPKAFHAAIAIQNKIYWAGGSNGTATMCDVEVRDLNTQTSSFMNLFQPNANILNWAFQRDNQIVFFRGSGYNDYNQPCYFDIYDVSTNTWSVGSLSHGGLGAAIAKDNIIYVVANTGSNIQLCKLEY